MTHLHPDGDVVQSQCSVRLIEVHLESHSVIAYSGQRAVVVYTRAQIYAVVTSRSLLGQLQIPHAAIDSDLVSKM